MPQNIYDDPDFFVGYSQFRRSQEGLEGAPEWATLRSMLPPIKGLRVIDLGCGFGAFARWAREAGAERVMGIDLSERMLLEARARTPDLGIIYLQANMEDLSLSDGICDLIYSSLALHYLEDIEAIFAKIGRLLVPGGYLVFSVEHPLFTAPSRPGWRTEADGSKIWPLDSYLLAGKRITDWITPGIVKYHRPLSHYINALVEQGFRLLHLEEWGPSPEQIAEWPELADEWHRPTFLLISAQKSPS